MNITHLDDIYSVVEQLLGKTPDDAELQSFLVAIGKWPLSAFGPEDLSIYLEDKRLGYCLLFEDCSTVRHPLATDKVAETPIFVGCFFYSEGVDGYRAYAGKLPSSITWFDTPNTLVYKLGTPMNEIMNKKTGALLGHRWQAGQWLLSASYSGGEKLKHLYLGIT